MRKLLFLCAVLLFTSLCCRAQTDDFDTTYNDGTLPYSGFDTSPGSFAKDVLGDTSVNFRDYSVSGDSIEAIKNSRAYRWSKDIDSLLRDAQDQPKNGSVRITVPDRSGSFLSSGPLQVLLWIIAGGAVLFIIFQLFMSKGAFRSAGPKIKMQESTEEDDDNIVGKDYADLMRKAYNEGKLKLATRWLFLLTLQKLNEKEMIAFSPDKTNSIYLAELPPAKKEGFATLALYYEYIWYGNAPITKENFSAVEGKFNDYLNRI